jgi:methyltransferase
MAAARLVELAFSRRNIADQGAGREGAWSRHTFPLIVALHASVIGGSFVFGSGIRLPWLALLVLMQPVRLWVLLTLGQRWNARGAVAPALKVATNGPYAHVRHPNYSVVFVELLALPLAFGLRRLAIIGALANVALLTLRIRDEEALLGELPGYPEHFGHLPRFLPGLF